MTNIKCKTFSKDLAKQILNYFWDENEDNSQINDKLQNLLDFGWDLVRKIYDTIKEYNQEVKNGREYNRTARQFYISGLGRVDYRDVSEERDLADRLFPFAQAIARELEETKRTKKVKPSFRDFLLDIYDTFKQRTLVDSIKKTLNQKLWNEDGALKSEIKDAIEEVINKYKEWLFENNINIDISDVIVVGSNASYTYNTKSDLDVHIVVNCNDETMMKLYDAYKAMFNATYNIKFKGINVEIYVQNSIEDLMSKSIYSIYTGWLKLPNRDEITQSDISKDLDKLVKEYNNLVKKPSLEGISKLLDKVYALRKSGLDSEGEYSKDNQLFKEFRRKGYLKKLKNLKYNVESEKLSIKDEVITTMSEEEIKKYKNYGNPKIFFLASEHGDCATDHVNVQGKMYVDANWKSAFNPKDKKRIEEIENYIKSHNIQTVQSVIGEDAFLSTRPYCRHTFKSLTADDVMRNSYSKPASIHNSKRGKKDSFMKKRFEVKAYFDEKLKHLADSAEFDNFTDAKKWLWEKSQKGHTVVLRDWQTGVEYGWKEVKDPEEIIIEGLTTADFEDSLDSELVELLVAHGSCGSKKEAQKRVETMSEEMKIEMMKTLKAKNKENLTNDAKTFSGKFPHLEALLTKLNAPMKIDDEELESVFDFEYRIEKDMLKIYDANEAYTIDYEEDINYEIANVAKEFNANFDKHQDHIFDDIEKALKKDGFKEPLEWENNVIMSILLPKKYLKDAHELIKIDNFDELKALSKDLFEHLHSLDVDFTEDIFVNNGTLIIETSVMDWKEHIWLDDEIEKFFTKKNMEADISIHEHENGDDAFEAIHTINIYKIKKETTKDVKPHKGEKKEDFISRFMSESKEEYPNQKQRLAVAYSYWKNK